MIYEEDEKTPDGDIYEIYATPQSNEDIQDPELDEEDILSINVDIPNDIVQMNNPDVRHLEIIS